MTSLKQQHAMATPLYLQPMDQPIIAPLMIPARVLQTTIIVDTTEASDEDEDEGGVEEAYAEEDFELDEEGNAVVSWLSLS